MHADERPPQDPRQIQRLLTGLILLLLLILALAVGLAAYPRLLPGRPAPTPALSPTLRPTFTAAPSATLAASATASYTPPPSRTPTPSLTPSPTLTASRTPTVTGPPPLPAAFPLLGSSYTLKAWNAADADDLIARLDAYPDSLSVTARGPNERGYLAAFEFAAQARQEALLRFPRAVQAEGWRWGLAYTYARMGDPRAASAYADLLTAALTSGAASLGDLSEWFAAREPRLNLALIPLTAPEGYASSQLAQIDASGPDADAGGAAVIWLLEGERAFRAYPLWSGFDFVRRPLTHLLLADFSGAGAGEDALGVAIVTDPTVITATLATPTPQAAAAVAPLPQLGEPLALPTVFDLTTIPPRPLPFLPSLEAAFTVGSEYENRWRVAPGESGAADLVFETTVFPACPVTLSRRYHWDGSAFVLASTAYQAAAPSTTLAACQLVVEHAWTVWGPAAAIEIMERLLPAWPPEPDPGSSAPPDNLDEWRFRLGVAHALLGQAESARFYLELAANQPTVAASRWIAPARAFLARFQTPPDLYPACVAAPLCDPQLALAEVIARLPSNANPDVVAELKAAGVDLRASGYFDFDGDGESERWFVVRHRPLERLQFWIAVRSRIDLHALPVGVISGDQPIPQLYAPDSPLRIVLIDNGQGVRDDLIFVLRRDPGSEQPYIRAIELPRLYPDRFRLAFAPRLEALMRGENPARLADELADLAAAPGLLCRTTWSCDDYYYYLGLAHELAGDRPAAIDAYLTLWSNYSKSPYTLMARLKLQGAALATLPASATASPTITPRTTALPTATFGPTATITWTPLPTVTGTPPTPTYTLTATVTGTITPPTPTLTPTATATATVTGTITP